MTTALVFQSASVPLRKRKPRKSKASNYRYRLNGERPGPRMLLREQPISAIETHTTPLSWILDDLGKHLPHVSLPRFPPVVYRLVSLLQGDDDPQQACQQGLVRRKRADRNTLATRDVKAEKDVLALETTAGRKRVYKRRPSAHPDGSFDMVQV